MRWFAGRLAWSIALLAVLLAVVVARSYYGWSVTTFLLAAAIALLAAIFVRLGRRGRV